MWKYDLIWNKGPWKREECWKMFERHRRRVWTQVSNFSFKLNVYSDLISLKGRSKDPIDEYCFDPKNPEETHTIMFWGIVCIQIHDQLVFRWKIERRGCSNLWIFMKTDSHTHHQKYERLHYYIVKNEMKESRIMRHTYRFSISENIYILEGKLNFNIRKYVPCKRLGRITERVCSQNLVYNTLLQPLCKLRNRQPGFKFKVMVKSEDKILHAVWWSFPD